MNGRHPCRLRIGSLPALCPPPARADWCPRGPWLCDWPAAGLARGEAGARRGWWGRSGGAGARRVRRDERGRVPEGCRGGEAAEVAAHGPGDAGHLQPLQTGHGGRREHRAPWYAGLQRQSKVGCLECIERNVQRRCNESLHSKSGRTKGQIWHLRTG